MSVTKLQCPVCGSVDTHECSMSRQRRHESAFPWDQDEACLHCANGHIWTAMLSTGEAVEYFINGERQHGGLHG